MPNFPIVVATIEKNSREVVRVSLDEFRGRKTIDVRVWYRDGNGLKPAKAGITASIAHLPALSESLQVALARARVEGLIDGSGD